MANLLKIGKAIAENLYTIHHAKRNLFSVDCISYDYKTCKQKAEEMLGEKWGMIKRSGWTIEKIDIITPVRL